jgi:hypothetical protein
VACKSEIGAETPAADHKCERHSRKLGVKHFTATRRDCALSRRESIDAFPEPVPVSNCDE